MGFYIMPQLFIASRADTHTHTHMHTRIQTFAGRSNSKKPGASRRPAPGLKILQFQQGQGPLQEKQGGCALFAPMVPTPLYVAIYTAASDSHHHLWITAESDLPHHFCTLAIFV